MRRFYFYSLLILFIVVSTGSLSAQSTAGTETAKAVVNFTQLAQYYAAHPQPLVRKNIPEQEDETRPQRLTPIDPAMIRTRTTSNHQQQQSLRLPELPLSPAPVDSFRSTLSDGTSIPPDTHGAADSNYLVTAINMCVHIQNRTGGNVSQVTLDQFWNSVLPSGTTGTFDPRIQYDQYTGRWIMVALSDGQNANSSLLVAMSQTNDPTGNWNLFRILIDNTGTNWLDFPNVGFNRKWIVVSGNLFPNSGSGSGGAQVYCFNKANIMSNTNANHTVIPQTSDFSICPAFVYDANEPNMWALESLGPQFSGSGVLQLWKITGAVGSEVMTSVAYPASTINWQTTSYAVSQTPAAGADFAPQSGTSNRIQTNDDRVNNVTYRNGKLWCSQNIFLPYSTSSDPTRASVQWWQVDTLGNPVQIGLIDDPTAANFYAFPSISVNQNDDALIGFSRFSSSIHPSAAYALHMHTDPVDSMRPYHTFRFGQNTYYQTFSGSDNRWGDYSATMFDPVNQTDFWTLGEASAPSADIWDTWWAHVTLCTGAPAAPTSVTRPTIHCPHTAATYSVPVISGATSYTWAVSGTGWSGSSTTNSISLTSGTVSATVSVSAVNSCGSSTAYVFTITPSTAPAAPTSVTLPATPCQGATAIYKVPVAANTTSYVWSITGTGWSGSGATSADSITLTAGSATGTLSVKDSNACGASSAYTVTVGETPRPVAPSSVTLPTAPCTNATGVYTVPVVPGATSYTWSVSGTGWSGTSTTNSITLTAGSGAATVSVTANNACGSSTAYVFTAPHAAGPAKPTTGTLPAVPCTNTTATYTVGAVGGATSYTWTVVGTGWSGTSTTNSITLTAGTTPAFISVTANNACASSVADTFTAPFAPLPTTPGPVTLPTAPCAGHTATYTVPAITGSLKYIWSVTGAGWTGSSTTNSIALTAGAAAASVSVKDSNSCGTSTAYVFSAPVTLSPDSAKSITAPSPLCSGESVTFTTPVIPNATSYNWTVSGTGWSGTSTTNSITLTAGTGPLTISVNGVSTCGSGVAYTLTALPVSASPSASFSLSSHSVYINTNVTITFNGTAPGATGYAWSFDGGNANPGTGAGPQTINWTTTGTKTVTLTLDNGGCISTHTDTVQVLSKSNGINVVTGPTIDGMNIIPNPASGQANIILNMASEASVSIVVYDITGQMITTLYNGTLGTGDHSIVFNTDNIVSGIYLVKVSDGRSSILKRFVKL